MAETPILQAKNLVFNIAGNYLINDVDCQFSPGELVALVGPNGAGKSTLLSILAGDIAPSSGAVILNGKPLADWADKDLALQRAVMLQSGEVRFGFTVEEMVQMGRVPHPVNKSADRTIVHQAIARSELTHLQTRNMMKLSGGEKARTNFARTDAQTCPILMLDEPTAALDLRHQELLLSRARQARDSGAIVLVVLHDLNLAARYADRMMILKQGKPVADGPPEEVLTASRIHEVYGQQVILLEHPETGVPLIVPCSGCDNLKRVN